MTSKYLHEQRLCAAVGHGEWGLQGQLRFNLADRARKTYTSEGVGDDATSVYLFGGSTMWGYGQRDLYTIPSQVARLAEDDGDSGPCQQLRSGGVGNLARTRPPPTVAQRRAHT